MIADLRAELNDPIAPADAHATPSAAASEVGPGTQAAVLKVHHRVKHGDAVFCVGSDPALGAWGAPVQLTWHEGDIWIVSLDLTVSKVPIEYKFFVAQHDLIEPVERQWEGGANHSLELKVVRDSTLAVVHHWGKAGRARAWDEEGKFICGDESSERTGRAPIATYGPLDSGWLPDHPFHPLDLVPTAVEKDDLQCEYHRFLLSIVTGLHTRFITREGVTKLRARGTRVLMLDFRTNAEQCMSTIRGAVRIPSPAPAPKDLKDPHNAALQKSISEAVNDALATGAVPALEPGDAVVCYCCAGVRSAVAASALEGKLKRPVYALFGGIVQWFNEGGSVTNAMGREVEAIHPVHKDLEKYVTRENKLIMESHAPCYGLYDDSEECKPLAECLRERLTEGEASSDSWMSYYGDPAATWDEEIHRSHRPPTSSPDNLGPWATTNAIPRAAGGDPILAVTEHTPQQDHLPSSSEDWE